MLDMIDHRLISWSVCRYLKQTCATELCRIVLLAGLPPLRPRCHWVSLWVTIIIIIIIITVIRLTWCKCRSFTRPRDNVMALKHVPRPASMHFSFSSVVLHQLCSANECTVHLTWFLFILRSSLRDFSSVCFMSLCTGLKAQVIIYK